MHSKGTNLLVSALITNQWVGVPMGLMEGAQEKARQCSASLHGKELGRATVQGQSTHWLRQGVPEAGGIGWEG